MKPIFTALILLFSLQSAVFSQDENMRYEDHVYLDFVKSVKFHHAGLFTSQPIIDLNSQGQLVLRFDDLEGGDKTYRYKIIHCDKDWNPSDIDEMEYLEGFQDEEIEQIRYSRGTYDDYTHYRLSLPNDDIRWTYSGNYILAIYEDEYDLQLAITRRFMVVEPQVFVDMEFRRPTNAIKFRTHQELDVKVRMNNFRISNPLNEVELVLMQNARWDNAIRDITPKFIKGDELMFNYMDRLSFPALKEFRTVDFRTLKSLGEGVEAIDINIEGYDVLVELNRLRAYEDFVSDKDLNGNFIIETIDDANDDISAEYVNAIFALESNYVFDTDIYLVGKFTDWQLKEEYKMQYDYQREIYLTEILLKQGYYDYTFAAMKDGENSIAAIEGSSYQTENEYAVLVYLREFGARYDRLIGVGSIDSDQY